MRKILKNFPKESIIKNKQNLHMYIKINQRKYEKKVLYFFFELIE